MEWIIIDLKMKTALYGKKNKTLKFSSFEIAEEVAKQFFNDPTECMIIYVTD